MTTLMFYIATVFAFIALIGFVAFLARENGEKNERAKRAEDRSKDAIGRAQLEYDISRLNDDDLNNRLYKSRP